MTNSVVFLDTETSGLEWDREPWEIAMIARNENGRENRYVIQISDFNESKLNPKAREINGFDKRYFKYNATDPGLFEVMDLKTALHCVAMVTRKAHIVGAVPNFDTEMLDRLIREHNLGIDYRWHYHLIDVENLAVAYLRAMQDIYVNRLGGIQASVPDDINLGFSLKPPWDSEGLSKAIGVEPPLKKDRHTALGDTIWAMRVYDRVMGIN